MGKALALVWLCATGALAQSNPEFERANGLVFDQKFAEAAKALEAAARNPGNPPEMVRRIYELQGVVSGHLGQGTKAREAFQALLSLAPKHELSGKQHNKVAAAFSAAQEWANTNPPLRFEAAKAGIDARGSVMQLATKVKSDAMRLARKVRFHLRTEAGSWRIQDSEIRGVYAAADLEAAGVEWWAELMGENERVLVLIASEAQPLREGKVVDRPVAATDAPKKGEVKVADPKAGPGSEALEQRKPVARSSSSGPLRPLGYVLIGVGVAAVGAGAGVGYLSSAARSRISGAEKDAQGRVIGISQREAAALETQASTQAVIANVLFGVGGGVALLGGVFWLVGGSSSESSAAIIPTVGGVVVSGTY